MEITEKQFSTTIEGLLNQYKWRWTHFRPARTEKGWRTPLSGHPGFVDYVAVNRDGEKVLFIELKGTKGVISTEQFGWINDLYKIARISVRIEVHVWWPKDANLAERILRR